MVLTKKDMEELPNMELEKVRELAGEYQLVTV
jgi:hypothetical protein